MLAFSGCLLRVGMELIGVLPGHFPRLTADRLYFLCAGLRAVASLDPAPGCCLPSSRSLRGLRFGFLTSVISFYRLLMPICVCINIIVLESPRRRFDYPLRAYIMVVKRRLNYSAILVALRERQFGCWEKTSFSDRAIKRWHIKALAEWCWANCQAFRTILEGGFFLVVWLLFFRSYSLRACRDLSSTIACLRIYVLLLWIKSVGFSY